MKPSEVKAILTEREMQVAALLCQGLKNSAIAEQLEINVKTVDTHRGHVLKKLKMPNNVALLRLLLTTGIVKLDGFLLVNADALVSPFDVAGYEAPAEAEPEPAAPSAA